MRGFGVAVLALILFPVITEAATVSKEQFIQELTPLVQRLTPPGCPAGDTSIACRTKNPGNITCGGCPHGRGSCPRAWTGPGNECRIGVVRRFGGDACNPPEQTNNTACFPGPEHGLAAMAAIIFQKHRAGCTSILAIIAGTEVNGCRSTGYAPRSHGNSPQAYANTVQRLTGINANMTFDPTNAIVMGKILTAMAYNENAPPRGGGLSFDAEKLYVGLSAAYGTGALPAGDPNFRSVPGPRFEPSPFDSVSGLFGLNSISPFSGLPVPPPGTQPSVLQQGQSALNTSSQLETIGAASTTPQSSMLLLVQPKNVKTGELVYVSWTSVNMKADSCSVKKNGAGFTIGSEGTKQDTASAGTVTYALSCTTPLGTIVESTATITIQ